jgi:hypothetical protein
VVSQPERSTRKTASSSSFPINGRANGIKSAAACGSLPFPPPEFVNIHFILNYRIKADKAKRKREKGRRKKGEGEGRREKVRRRKK